MGRRCVQQSSAFLRSASVVPVGPHPYAGEDRSQIVTLGAFVGPLESGLHTVRARGGLFGRGVVECEGISFIEIDFTYDVAVVDTA